VTATPPPPGPTPRSLAARGGSGPVGVYPGSFDPPTVAHLAIADAARDHAGLARVDLVISQVALGKEGKAATSPEERLEVLSAVAASRPWLGAAITASRLVAEIARGYDVVIMGADKWAQVRDPAWYGGSVEDRDEAVARLPRVLVAPRSAHTLRASEMAPAELLRVDADHLEVSSSAVRAGRHDWLLPEAAAWARRRAAPVWGVAVAGR